MLFVLLLLPFEVFTQLGQVHVGLPGIVVGRHVRGSGRIDEPRRRTRRRMLHRTENGSANAVAKGRVCANGTLAGGASHCGS